MDGANLFVAGFGRCGTTLAMTMLDRGGFPVAGPRPAYEVPEMRLGRPDTEWVRRQTGRAVKWVDPLNARISRNDLRGPAVVIHMTRPAREIAASQVKMAAMTFVGVPNDRRTRRAFAADILSKEGALSARLDSLGVVYHLSFDWVLSRPDEAAAKLAAIVKHEFGRDFDTLRAADAVIPRSPLCAPDMSIELMLLSSTSPSVDAT